MLVQYNRFLHCADTNELLIKIGCTPSKAEILSRSSLRIEATFSKTKNLGFTSFNKRKFIKAGEMLRILLTKSTQKTLKARSIVSCSEVPG